VRCSNVLYYGLINNTASCGIHPSSLTVAYSRRRDSEELIEHVLRIVLGFDLREPVVMLAKDVFRPLVVLLHRFVSHNSTLY